MPHADCSSSQSFGVLNNVLGRDLVGDTLCIGTVFGRLVTQVDDGEREEYRDHRDHEPSRVEVNIQPFRGADSRLLARPVGGS